MPTLSWLIERLLVKPTEGSETNVVITADWRCNGFVQSPTEAYSGTCYGSCSFAPPSGDFTPYKDLTQDQVLNWCYANGVDQAAIEANVTQQINDQINPPVVTLPLPWVPAVKVAEPVVEIVPPLIEQKVPEIVASENVATADSIVDAPAA
jgi:hypothetical protein